ncbi:MAG TPA: hypothetical protein VM432_12340, partial [Bdellovibrionales bacterium]|nr:hypothetical protein [Bdellovibrionales bacterium]
LQQLGTELACWVPPAVTWFAENQTKFPVKKDLAVMAIDIIDSGKIHGIKVGQKSLRSFVMEQFSMLVLKHGGYVESVEGDASYANFGLSHHTDRPCDAALAVAHEFRAALRGIASHHGQTIECGIGLHFAPQTEANISETHVSTAHGVVVQKNFYTSSTHIDLVHRMEKFVHKIPGSNIVFTRTFLEQLGTPPEREFESIGEHLFKGQTAPVELLLIRSMLVKDADLTQLLSPAAA